MGSAPLSTAHEKRIGLILDPAPPYVQRMLEGFADEASTHLDWDVRWDFVTIGRSVDLPVLRAWKPQVVACMIPDALQAAGLLGCPMISLNATLAGEQTYIDEVAIGRVAADHLLECGLRRLACLYNKETGSTWWPLRNQGFIQRARACAVEAVQFPGPSIIDPRWCDAFIAWVEQDPLPVGVFTGNDQYARSLAQACTDRGLIVPDRVSIIGADDSRWHCLLAPLPLSSVVVPHYTLGREAARLVARRLGAPKAPIQQIPLPPSGVAVRRSTDIRSTIDGMVDAARRYIEQHVDDALRIDGMARHLGCSRRSLEMRVRKATGGSVLEFVHRIRIRRAESILRDESRSVQQVAAACGFTSATRFASIFRRITGLNPAAYRARISRGA